MNGDPASDRTARLDDGIGTVGDSPAVTRADDGFPTGSGEPDRVEPADADGLQATLAGESIGPRPDATVGGESVGLVPERTLADRCVPGGAGSGPSARGAESTTMAGDDPIDPAHPGAATLGDGRPAGGTPRPKPVVPGYEILGELGRGGMGVVYLARQVRLNRFCALKMILAGDHASREAALRFQTEAETIARLRHPNIAQIYHIGDCGGLVFYEMEYIEGGSLEAKLDGTPWPSPRAAALVEALARGVSQAHQLGIIHRDLKPGNILMDADGTPKIADFGLAKTLNVQSGLTQTDSVLGSPSYMAPEQAGGHAKDVGPAADVYAMGAILYELLTGRPPFKAATLLETLEQVKTIEPVSPARLIPGLPRDMETICLKCLQKEPARRYPDAAALLEDLRRFQAGEPIVARRTHRVERARRWCRRNPLIAGMAATLLLVLVGGFAATTALWLRAERMRAEAEENFGRARAAVDDYLTRVAESRLLGVPGLQPLRKELLASALPYYESFVRQRAGDPALAHELASAHVRLARIDAELGRAPEALEGYRKALEIFSRGGGAPGSADPRHEDEVARCHQAMGDVHRRGEDLPAAMQSYKAAEAIWRKAAGSARAFSGGAETGGSPSWPDDAGRRDALAILLDRMGAVHEKAGELQEAVRCYGESVQIEWGILRGDTKPGDPTGLDHHLARMFIKLGDLQVQMNMEPGALRWVVGNAVTDTSDFGGGAGDRFPFYRRAETILTRLIRDFPADARADDFRSDLADCREHEAGALAGLDRTDEALASYREALGIRRRLAQSNPAVTDYREGLARVGFDLARLLDRIGKRDEALELYRLTVEHQRMVVATSPGAIPPRRDLARQLAALGEAERRAGRTSQAMDDYGEAGKLIEGMARPSAEDLYVLATAHAGRAGLAGPTGPGRERADRSAAAVAALSRSIDAGFEGHDRARKEAAFEPLRSRDDFKAQMARLAEIARGPEWLTDLDDARRRAAAHGKDLFLYFSGSDWCPWCHVLEKTVFERRAFARYAARSLILVRLDNPQRGAPPPNAALRDALARRWQVYGVPSVFLADAAGRPYAELRGSASEEARRRYTEDLDRLRGGRTARDEAMGRAAASQGIERARHLAQALEAMKELSPQVVMADYADLIAQVFALDPEDRTGLKARYARYAEVAWKARHDEAQEALKRRDWQEALEECNAILADLKPTGRSARETRITRARALKGLGKDGEAEAEFGRVIEPCRKLVEERRAALDAAPADGDRRKALSESYSDLIATLRESGRPAEAAALASRRGELWPGNPTELYNVACELALSAAPPEAGEGGRRPADADAEAARRRIADQAMEALGRSVLAGFVDARWMKQDPDLEVLHARDDYRALIRSVRELGRPATPASELRRFAGHPSNSPPMVVALPDGRRLLSAAGDRTLRLWEVETGREVRRLETGGLVLALASSADGRRVLTGGIDRAVQVWDMEAGGTPRRIALGANIAALACTPDGRRGLAGLSDSTLRLLDLDAGGEVRRLEAIGARTTRAVAIAPDGRRALSGGDDNMVRLWDLQSGLELQRLVESRALIFAVAFSPDGRRGLAGCDDGVLITWDLGDWRKVRRLESGAGPITSAAFVPDGRRAISAHATGALIVWDLDAGREVLRLHGAGGHPNLAVLPDGRRVLCGDSDGMIRLWSLDEELVRPRELDLLGRWAEAGAALDRSLRGRPDDPRLLVLRGRHDMLLGRWDEAVADFRKAIELGRADGSVLALAAGALEVPPPSPGEGAEKLLELLDPGAPRAVTFWLKLDRPGLGIDGAPLPDGLRLVSIDPKGGAAKAGLRAGDVISAIAGKPVVDVASLRAALKGRLPGGPVEVTARRGESSFRRTVTLGSLPTPLVARQGQTREALDADHRRFLDAGYRPAYITTYLGWRRQPTYAGLWLKDDRPYLARVEAPADVFEKQSRELPAGYRLDWFQVSGDAARRRWSAVWVAAPDRAPWEWHQDLARPELSATIDRLAGQGYRPAMIAAAPGPGEEMRYSGVWIKDGIPSRVRVHVTADELQQELAGLSAGWRPAWVDVYKEGGRRCYTAIFIEDASRAEWQLFHDTPEWGLQTIIKMLTDEGFAPVLLDLE